MRELLVLFAIICGVVLALHIGTGDLKPEQVTGVGLILLGVAFYAPSAWPRP